MDETLRTRSVQMLSNLGNGLKRQFELQTFWDVTLTTTNHDSSESGPSEQAELSEPSGPSVKCIKAVLAATTKHFNNYLNGRAGNDVNTIDVSPMHIDTLRETVMYLYNGECLINEMNVFDLLDTANTWVIPELAADCCKFLIIGNTTGNVCKFYEKLRMLDFRDTSAELCNFIRKHFKELCGNQHIACLSLSSFNNVIEADAINVDKEDMIFYGALLVIENQSDPVNPEELTKCWELIRFERMSVTYLVGTVMYHKLLRDAPQNRYVKQAIIRIHKDSESTTIRAQRTPVETAQHTDTDTDTE